MEQLRGQDVAVFGASSLHGGVDDDKQHWKHLQLSRQRRHTECVENSLLVYLSIHGTKLWMRLSEHHLTEVVLDCDYWLV